MAEGRKSLRKTCHGSINYTAVALKDGKARFLDLTGKIVNVSKTGLCFLTKYPLRTGHVLEFKGHVLNCSHAVVVWIRNHGGLYLAGTRFIG